MTERSMLGVRSDDLEKACAELLSKEDNEAVLKRSAELAITRNKEQAQWGHTGFPSATHRSF